MKLFKSNVSAALTLFGLLAITGFLIYGFMYRNFNPEHSGLKFRYREGGRGNCVFPRVGRQGASLRANAGNRGCPENIAREAPMFLGAQKPLPGPPPPNQWKTTAKRQPEPEIKSSKQPAQKPENAVQQNKKEQTEIARTNIDKSAKNQTFPAKVLLNNVPFTSQAPFGKWQDPIYQNACEEASILMAMRWIENRTLSKEEAKKEIAEIANFQLEKYGHFHDSSAEDTVRLIKDYFNYQNAKVISDIGIKEIKSELAAGNLVIVPADGRKLKNPFYTPPGAERHMIVIRGYDDEAGEFITNDPGTRRGESFRYSYEIIENAIGDYTSGYHEPILERRKVMIVISLEK